MKQSLRIERLNGMVSFALEGLPPRSPHSLVITASCGEQSVSFVRDVMALRRNNFIPSSMDRLDETLDQISMP